MSQISVLVADDDAAMRAALVKTLDTHFSVSQAVADGKELFDAVLQHGADVVVTDIHMPALSGIEVLRGLRLVGHLVPFVMVSASSDAALESLRSGASAFVCKVDVGSELVAAVHAALDGRTYLSANATHWLWRPGDS